MTESLRDVLAKVKQQREADKQKATKPEPKPEPEIEMQVEEPQIEEPKPVFKPKPLPKQEIQPVQAPQPTPEPKPLPDYYVPEPKKSEAELIMEEIEMLHNNGIFRRELLVKIERLNINLANLNKMLGGI